MLFAFYLLSLLSERFRFIHKGCGVTWRADKSWRIVSVKVMLSESSNLISLMIAWCVIPVADFMLVILINSVFNDAAHTTDIKSLRGLSGYVVTSPGRTKPSCAVAIFLIIRCLRRLDILFLDCVINRISRFLYLLKIRKSLHTRISKGWAKLTHCAT